MDLPLQDYSMLSFCQTAKRLLAVDQEAFVRFVLCGRYEDHRVILDPLIDTVDPEDTINITRDFDSLLAIVEHLKISSDLALYPVAKKEDTLTTDVHFTHQFVSSQGAFVARLNHVPNICIAKFDTHHSVRAFFPELHDDNRTTPQLTQGEMKEFYENGLRPAIEYLHDANEWPIKYEDAMFRSRGKDGRLQFETKLFPGWLSMWLGDIIREKLKAKRCRMYYGMVFLVQIRGVKNSCRHSADAIQAPIALSQFIEQNHLDLEDMLDERNAVFVDVALEASSTGFGDCFLWRTDKHFDVLKNVLRISDAHAERLSSVGSGQYSRNLISHLPGVSGGRHRLGRNARGPFNARYLQTYPTCKSLTYRLDQGHFSKFITPSDILKGKAPRFCSNLYDLYRNAASSNASAARVEVRVPIAFANQVLLDMDDDFFRQALVAFPKSVWWSLRAYRLKAAELLLQWQADGPAQLRMKQPALLLTAALSWFINGLHSAPDSGASSKALMKATLPHVDRVGADPNILAFGTPYDDDNGIPSDDDDLLPAHRPRNDEETLPAMRDGILFFRDIMLGGGIQVPRFRNNTQGFLPDTAFQYLFKVSFENIEGTYFREALVAPPHPARVRNRTHRTPRFRNYGHVQEGRRFNLAAAGHRLPTPPMDPGSDMEVDVEHDPEPHIDDECTSTWLQFLLDLTAKSPNRRGATKGPYCILDAAARLQVTDATYSDRRVSNYFNDIQYKIIDSQEGWRRIFDRFFLKKGVMREGTTQNFKQCTYLAMWKALCERASEDIVEVMRDGLFEKFNQLYWVPAINKERIWYTKVEPRFTKPAGLDPEEPAPQIFVYRTRPLW